MCTSIVEIVGASGAGRGSDGWFDLTHPVVSYDHPHHALLEEAITIDFMNLGCGPGARVAVALTLESAKQLNGALARAIAAAEVEEGGRSRNAYGALRSLDRKLNALPRRKRQRLPGVTSLRASSG